MKKGRRIPIWDPVPLLLLLSAAGLFVVLSAFVQADASVLPGESTAVATSVDGVGLPEGDDVQETSEIITHPIPEPTRIVVPIIELDAPIVSIGLDEDNELEPVPYHKAAWYAIGPAPGEPGPAVIFGHVDTTRWEDVFYRLIDLRRGAEIFIYGIDGDVAVFVVDSIEKQLKISLPRERIWDYTPQPVIRLITCGGEYNRSTGHYLSNVIVYGHLVR